jgi:hypothetical protein
MNDSTLSAMEKRICDWLVENFEPKLKDHFLADLSWAVEGDISLNVIKEIWSTEQEYGYANTRPQAIVNFFTKRIGKRVYDILPDDIKNYILANSL